MADTREVITINDAPLLSVLASDNRSLQDNTAFVTKICVTCDRDVLVNKFDADRFNYFQCFPCAREDLGVAEEYQGNRAANRKQLKRAKQ